MEDDEIWEQSEQMRHIQFVEDLVEMKVERLGMYDLFIDPLNISSPRWNSNLIGTSTWEGVVNGFSI